MTARRILASCAAATILWLSATTAAQAQSPALLTGSAFRKELEGTTAIVWKDKRTLRAALAQLSDAKRLAIILDRRVDPDQLVEFSVSDVSLEQALKQLATRLNLGVSCFDSTIFIGPVATTARLATVAASQHDKANQAPTERRAKLRALDPLTTTALSTPRELLEAWATECGVTLHHADKIPHDLWPALHYPAQSAATRASLMLAGFDLAIEFSADGSAARVIPLPEKPTLVRTYDGGTNPRNRASQIASRFPLADIKPEGSKLTVAGSFEDHDLIARLLRGETIRRVDVGPGEKRYTLNVENQPLAGVLNAVAKEVKLTVEFDPAISDKLPERISFKVKDVSLEELIKTILAPADLDYLLMEDKIKVLSKK